MFQRCISCYVQKLAFQRQFFQPLASTRAASRPTSIAYKIQTVTSTEIDKLLTTSSATTLLSSIASAIGTTTQRRSDSQVAPLPPWKQARQPALMDNFSPTPISGKPTPHDIQCLCKELVANAMAIPSTHRGGQYEHLPLVLPAANLFKLTKVAFVPLGHPGQPPIHQPNATDNTSM